MRVLIINKFLYPNGGSETYIFKLGEALEQHGHEVQYFGMEHEGRCVGNRVNAYTSGMDFHGGSKLSKLTYPIKTIYSKEARVQLRKVLDDFKPDVCHLNNFNYQLTPSIILEIVRWRKENGRDCKIIFTAHDYQLVCPNHIHVTLLLEVKIKLVGAFLMKVQKQIILITPFVSLYTGGISDIDYYQPLFATLLCLAEYVYCTSLTYNNMIMAAGHIKQTQWISVTEAIINIVLSLILVKWIGIIGVALGTLIAFAFNTVANICLYEKVYF